MKKVADLSEDDITKDDKDDKILTFLTMHRNKGNHVHNLNVKMKGKGFLLITRAPAGEGPFLKVITSLVQVVFSRCLI